jgi:hypothetical protein
MDHGWRELPFARWPPCDLFCFRQLERNGPPLIARCTYLRVGPSPWRHGPPVWCIYRLFFFEHSIVSFFTDDDYGFDLI